MQPLSLSASLPLCCFLWACHLLQPLNWRLPVFAAVSFPGSSSTQKITAAAPVCFSLFFPSHVLQWNLPFTLTAKKQNAEEAARVCVVLLHIHARPNHLEKREDVEEITACCQPEAKLRWFPSETDTDPVCEEPHDAAHLCSEAEVRSAPLPLLTGTLFPVETNRKHLWAPNTGDSSAVYPPNQQESVLQ